MNIKALALSLALLPTSAMAQDYLSVNPDPNGGGSTYYTRLPNGDVLEVPANPNEGSTYYLQIPGGHDSPMVGTTPNGEATCDTPDFCAGQ